MIQLSSMEAVGLYLLLKKGEGELDTILLPLFQRLESCLFDYLSIEELENLKKLYQENLDVLDQRGYF